MIERGVEKGLAYFFSPCGELRKIIKTNMCCAVYVQGSPGNLAGIQSVFVNSKNEFGTFDQGYRLSLWDPSGNLTYSIALPTYQLKDFYYLIPPVFDHSTFASGLYHFNPVDSSGNTEFVLLSFDDPGFAPKIIPLRNDAVKLACKKGAQAYIKILVTPLSSGSFACNINFFPEIYLISKSGKVITADTVPSHFRSLMDADSFALKPSELEDSNGHMSEAAERWFSSWSHSYQSYEISENRLLVPRVLYPTYYLDIYSYSDTNISYIGYVSTQKRFLYADTSGVYLEESWDVDKRVVGKYSLVDFSHLDNIAAKEIEATEISEKISGIKKVESNPGGDCSKCSREKEYKGRKKAIRNLKLVSPDGNEYVLLDSLSPGKEHLILLSARLGLVSTMATSIARDFVRENPELSLVIVLTHPYPQELNESLKLLRIMQTDYRILSNIDENRLKPYLKSPVSILKLSKEGEIIESAEWPKFEFHTRQ